MVFTRIVQFWDFSSNAKAHWRCFVGLTAYEIFHYVLFFGCCLIRPCVSVCVQYIGVSWNVVSPPGWVGVWTRLHSYDSQLSASEPSTAARSEPEPEPATTPAHLPSIPCSSPARRQPHGLSRAHRAAHAGSRRPRFPQDLPGPGLQVWLRALTTEFKKIYIYTYINSHQN